MGKSVPSPVRLQEFSRAITSNRLHRTPTCQLLKTRPTISSPQPDNLGGAPFDSKDPQQKQFLHLALETKKMEANNSNSKSTSAADQGRRIPLAEVVADCMKRWFLDTLKEAKAGDTAMQVLVSQMYYSGYGIPRDAQKARAWMNRASRTRSSVWKVGDKHPGYNASDSDSEDTKDHAK